MVFCRRKQGRGFLDLFYWAFHLSHVHWTKSPIFLSSLTNFPPILIFLFPLQEKEKWFSFRNVKCCYCRKTYLLLFLFFKKKLYFTHSLMTKKEKSRDSTQNWWWCAFGILETRYSDKEIYFLNLITGHRSKQQSPSITIQPATKCHSNRCFQTKQNNCKVSLSSDMSPSVG